MLPEGLQNSVKTVLAPEMSSVTVKLTVTVAGPFVVLIVEGVKFRAPSVGG